MKRALLLTLALLIGSAAAQEAAPNVFETGSPMSASAMNENLEWLSDRIAVVRESVIETRRVQVQMRDRVRSVTPIVESFSVNLEDSAITAQQEETLPWPFKAGDFVDADAVNDSFAAFTADSYNIAEFNALMATEMTSIAANLTAAEQAHGLSDGSRAEVQLDVYEAPSLTEFDKGARIVAAEVNDNFAATAASVAAIEQQAAELAAWVAHELSRLEAIELVAGAPTLPEEAYALSVLGALDPGEYSESTLIYVAGLTSVSSDGDWYTQWLGTSPYSVSATGTFAVEIDARDLQDQGLSMGPENLANMFIPIVDPSTESRSLYVSNPSAVLNVISSMTVYQRDPAGTFLPSHTLYHFVQSAYSRSSASLVFSDRPVTLEGRWSMTLGDYVQELDIRLEPGWNLVYWTWDPSEPDLDVYTSRPLQADDEASPTLNGMTLGRSTNANQVYGYSLIGNHEPTASTESVALASRSRPNGTASYLLTGPRWINHNVAPLRLVPLDQIVPDAPDSFSSDDADARFLLARLYAYDQATVAAGEMGRADTAMGEFLPRSVAGNAVWIIYADRSTTIQADHTMPGMRLVTEPGGLALQFGWNFIEALPNGGGTGEFVLRPHTGPTPTLDLLTF